MKFSDAVLPIAVIAVVALGAYWVLGDKMIQQDAELADNTDVMVVDPSQAEVDAMDKEEMENASGTEDVVASGTEVMEEKELAEEVIDAEVEKELTEQVIEAGVDQMEKN